MAVLLRLRIWEIGHCGLTLVQRGRSPQRNPLPRAPLLHPQSGLLLNRLPNPHRNHRSRQRCHPVFTEVRTWQTRKGPTVKALQPVEGLVDIYLELPAEMRTTIGWLTNRRNLSHPQSQNDRCLLESRRNICHPHRSGSHLLKSGSLIYHLLRRSVHLSISDPLHLRSMRFPIWMKTE